MERLRAELARGVERYIFRRVAADASPLLDDHTREIIAEAIAWAVVHALNTHRATEPHGDGLPHAAAARAVPVAVRR